MNFNMVSPPIFPFYLFFPNNVSWEPKLIYPKLFLKIFGSSLITSTLLLTNIYTASETNKDINNYLTLEGKIEKARERKKDFKDESIFFKPFVFGEYIVANKYLKN